MKNKRSYLLLFIFFIPVCTILTQCLSTVKKEDSRGANYAGSAKCMKCHEDIYNSYLKTAHNQTSRPASIHTMHGDFSAAGNSFNITDSLKVVMEKRDSGLYQVAYKNGKQTRAQKFDITFGTVKAETYLYWKGDQLYELPVSYFSALHGWANSPGYATGIVNFERPITSKCMECHSSYISEKENKNESIVKREIQFEKSSIIYGIDCERCHGPAAEHVDFHTAHPGEKKAFHIVTYQSLTRAQKLDACAVCHSGGNDNFLVSAFKFKAGDTLSKFKEPEFFHQNLKPDALDVHGNQSGLLAASKCFLMSNMECNTCHNTHVNDRANLIAYSKRCMSCHNDANHNFCSMAPKFGALIKNNCIDCHMPAKPSNIIKAKSADGRMIAPYLVRTHYITIYPEESAKVLAFLKKQKT